jgi:signal transduction histidine kinase
LSTPDVGPLDRPSALPTLSAARMRVLVAACVALTAGAFWVSFDGGYSENQGLAAAGRALGVFTPIAIALYLWRRRSTQSYPTLLLMLGFAAAPVTLAESHDPTLYSAGRVSAWIAEAMFIVVCLAFPSGAFSARRDRMIAAAVAVLVAVLYLPTALMVETYPSPSTGTTCMNDCPPNAFMVLNSEPAFIGDAVIPLRQVATVLLMLAVVAVLVGRLRSATRLARRTLAPGVVVAVGHAVALAAGLILRWAGADNDLVAALSWLLVLSPAALAVAVLASEDRRRQFAASALERLAVGLPDHATAAALRDGMSRSLQDPELRMAFYAEGGGDAHWVDENGWPVERPAGGPGVTTVRAGPREVAAIVHDPWLGEDPALLAAASSYALVVLENERLVTDLRSSLEELAQSRARVVAAADGERRRIERDLHDGAQQRLVGLRIQLELAAARLRPDSPCEADVLMELGGGVDATIDEVRSLATGVYPAVLAEQGLEEALRSAARRAPIATGVIANDVRRWAPDIETTVYFACVEALQNAVKHAGGASGVTILLDGTDGRLRFEVRDDGIGFALNGNGPGHGIVNMHDRVGALGGELAVLSAPGQGTRVVGTVPTS